jgi:tRNA (guanine37-N1)-methyltransferase
LNTIRIDVVTLFPDDLRASLAFGVTGRAIRDGLVDLHCWNPREQAHDRRGTVDDRPFGGGPGMLMQVAPLAMTLEQVKAADAPPSPVSFLSPQGRKLNQRWVGELAGRPRLILLCGRYEGIDERLIQRHVDEEWSIGDYVLSGGELAAAVVIDAVTRLQPGALGKGESAQQDSFMDGLLDCPHYTRPEELGGDRVPEVLLGGDHGAIARWRLKQALGRTWLRRPDLLAAKTLTDEERALLREFMREYRADCKNQPR